MMRGTSELPVTRNMPFASNSVPTRNQPRNMTGIYLGLEGNIKPPQKRGLPSANSIPPLARARGYSRIKTPTEHRRYRMVEQLRIKEEKRGFVGQPLKRPKSMIATGPEQRKNTVISPELSTCEVVSNRPLTAAISPRGLGNMAAKNWGPGKFSNREDIYDLIHTNPRNYTVVVNNGVTRSENLTGLMSFSMDQTSVAWPEVLADEVHRISTKDVDEYSALEECYKKVCKGNVESLQSLLPYRKQQKEPPSYSTGFTVRSYRNPNRAQIMAEFSEDVAATRPKTVPPNRPMVPSPYFFKYYSNNKYPSSAKSNRRLHPQSPQNQFSAMNGTTKIIAAPGAGVLSRSLKSRAGTWSENDYKLHTKIHGTPGTPTEPTHGEDLMGDNSDIKEVNLKPIDRPASHDRNSRLSTPTQPLNSPTPTDDINISGRQVQIPMTATTADEENNGKIENTTKKEPTPDNVNQIPAESMEENKTQEIDTTVTSGGREENNTLEHKTMDADRTEDETKKEKFVLGVADEHGTEGEVEIDAPDQEDSEKAPIRGNVRKASISEKMEKSRVSQAYIEGLKVNAEQRKKNLEKMLDEHAELVQEISRVSSSENIISDDRDQ